MKIEKELLENRQAKLTVEYTADEFQAFKRRAAKKIAKNTKIPGFRPGKAPYQVVVNHYGEDAIIQEAIDILLDDDYGHMLKESEIEPSGVGQVESIDQLDPPKFVFMIPLEPEIDLGDYREIRKDYAPEDFDVSEVDEFIDRIRRNSATIIPAEHPAKEDDLVYFNISGEFLNPEEGEDAIITDKTPQQVIIPSDDKKSDGEWPYPGFAKALLGSKDGDTFELQYSYPDDYEDEEFQGKTAVYTVEIQSVKTLELPELDEDFVQSLGNYENPEEFRKDIEARLREEHQNAYDQNYFDELINEIVEKSKLNYPPQMLAEEEQHLLEDFKSRVENQNMTLENYLKLREMDEETFIAEQISPVAKQSLERSLVFDTLVDAEGLKLDEQKLKESISHVMGEVLQSGNMQEMQKHMGEEGFSRAISMEGVKRAMNAQVQERLKLIATGQPIPEDVPAEIPENQDLESEKRIEEENSSGAEEEKQIETDAGLKELENDASGEDLAEKADNEQPLADAEEKQEND